MKGVYMNELSEYESALRVELFTATHVVEEEGGKDSCLIREDEKERAVAIIHALAACEQVKQLERIANWLEHTTITNPIPTYEVNRT